MYILKLKYTTIFKLFVAIILLLVLYTILVSSLLNANYHRISRIYEEKRLEGKNIENLIAYTGKPTEIDYVTDWSYDQKTYNVRSNGNAYVRLTYYTESSIINKIGWLPCGGIRIFADLNNKITGIKEYCY